MKAVAEVKVRTKKIIDKYNIPVSDRVIPEEVQQIWKKEIEEAKANAKKQPLKDTIEDFRKIMEL